MLLNNFKIKFEEEDFEKNSLFLKQHESKDKKPIFWPSINQININEKEISFNENIKNSFIEFLKENHSNFNELFSIFKQILSIYTFISFMKNDFIKYVDISCFFITENNIIKIFKLNNIKNNELESFYQILLLIFNLKELETKENLYINLEELKKICNFSLSQKNHKFKILKSCLKYIYKNLNSFSLSKLYKLTIGKNEIKNIILEEKIDKNENILLNFKISNKSERIIINGLCAKNVKFNFTNEKYYFNIKLK